MHFHILDTYSTYRRLLDAPDSAARERLFCDQLVAPFDSLVQIFGGGDGLKAFAGWGMSPHQFAADQRDHWAALIDTLAEHHAWEQAAESLVEAREAFAGVLDRIPTQQIVFGLLLADLSATPEAGGYSGFGAIPGYIMTIYGEANAITLPRVKAATVHEFHHNVLNTIFPFNPMTTTVAQYAVMEGLAESFAAELYGEALTGPWVWQFDESRLEESRRIFAAGLHETGFDKIRGYIFGGNIAARMGLYDAGLPDYAGYALGYRAVQAYLRRTGKSVVEATFVPADQIIAESGYFA